MNSHGMSQHVNEATRVVSIVSSPLIDHIYSICFSEKIQFIDIPKIGLSDHYPIFFTHRVKGGCGCLTEVRVSFCLTLSIFPVN